MKKSVITFLFLVFMGNLAAMSDYEMIFNEMTRQEGMSSEEIEEEKIFFDKMRRGGIPIEGICSKMRDDIEILEWMREHGDSVEKIRKQAMRNRTMRRESLLKEARLRKQERQKEMREEAKRQREMLLDVFKVLVYSGKSYGPSNEFIISRLKAFFDDGLYVNGVNSYFTLLNVALGLRCCGKNACPTLEIVKFLIDRGADVNFVVERTMASAPLSLALNERLDSPEREQIVYLLLSRIEFQKEMQALYDSRSESGDFTIIVDGTGIKVHKAILVARSNRFRDMFLNTRDISNQVTDVSGLSLLAFNALIEFIYTGLISNLTTEVAEDLLYINVTEYYQLRNRNFEPYLQDFLRKELT